MTDEELVGLKIGDEVWVKTRVADIYPDAVFVGPVTATWSVRPHNVISASEIDRLRAPAVTDEMVEAIIAWWEMQRPLSWSLEQHINSPGVNLSYEHEYRLAKLAASLAALGREGDGKIAGIQWPAPAEQNECWHETCPLCSQMFDARSGHQCKAESAEIELVRLALWLLGGFECPTHAHGEEVLQAFARGDRAPLGLAAAITVDSPHGQEAL
jgi:hypothetical protein